MNSFEFGKLIKTFQYLKCGYIVGPVFKNKNILCTFLVKIKSFSCPFVGQWEGYNPLEKAHISKHILHLIEQVSDPHYSFALTVQTDKQQDIIQNCETP